MKYEIAATALPMKTHNCNVTWLKFELLYYESPNGYAQHKSGDFRNCCNSKGHVSCSYTSTLEIIRTSDETGCALANVKMLCIVFWHKTKKS